jgi:hypothetical protein
LRRSAFCPRNSSKIQADVEMLARIVREVGIPPQIEL